MVSLFDNRQTGLLLVGFLAVALRGQSVQPLSDDVLNLQSLSEDDLAAIESLLESPLPLNDASPADLWFLDDTLATAVLAARQTGPFHDWGDVAQRTGLTPASIDALRQLLYLPDTDGVSAKLSSRITTSGAGERIRTRLNVQGDRWSAQWVVQKDPGEYQLTDLSDFSLTFERDGTQLVLGAQRFTWGLGLVLADEFAPPRGAALLRPATRLRRLRPGYSNTNRGVLRGAGLAHQWGRVTLLVGTSRQQIDMTTHADGTPRVVAYRLHTGPVTTTTENLTYLAGTVALLGWDLGALTTQYHLQATTGTPALEQQITSLVVSRGLVGRSGEWRVIHEEAFGLSTALTGTGGTLDRSGWPAGGARQTRLTFSGHKGPLGQPFRFTLLYRSYPPGWTPLRGRLVGDQVSRGNESGWFWGWQWGRRSWKLAGYLDSYGQQQAATVGDWPREGWESGLTLRAKRRQVETNIFYRYREEEIGVLSQTQDGLDNFRRLTTIRHYARVSATMRWSTALKLKLTAISILSRGKEGSGRGQTVGGSWHHRSSSGTALSLGSYWFDTDDWEHRLYVYEDGLPGEFNFRALAHRGVRIYGRLSWPVGTGRISLRISQEWRAIGESISARENILQVGVQMDVAL